jgi:hypothetical protein
MGLEAIVLGATGIWVAVILFVIGLCRAAKCGDHDMEAALAQPIAQPPTVERTLRTLDLSQAAAALGVTPETLLAWEERYGFPTSSASERRYNQSEVLALRDNISDGFSIAAAVARARAAARRRRTPTGAWVADHRDDGLAS